MKQRKFGQKIKNWHRPLGRHQLRQRFLRHRDNDAVDMEDEAFWDAPGPNHYMYTDDYQFLDNLDAAIRAISRPRSRGAQNQTTGDRPACGPTPLAGPSKGVASCDLTLEDSLAEYIGSFFMRDSLDFQSRIIASVGGRQSLEVIRSVVCKAECPELLVRKICLFSPFWIRSPQTWKPGNAASLLDHLFVRYEVPRFFYREWLRFPFDVEDPFGIKWLVWFVLLGQGAGLRRADNRFHWRIAARFPHYLWEAPEDVPPVQACMFAEVRRWGGTERDFRRLCAHPAFVLDPTEASGRELELQDGFWEDTVRWLIAHGDGMTDAESELVLSWSRHEYTEGNCGRRRPFSWKGRRLRAVLEQSNEHRHASARAGATGQWPGHNWDWVADDEALSGWSFVELTSSDQLVAEGAAMHHCVASYTSYCLAGQSAIVSARFDGHRRLTLEIEPSTRRVVQTQGAWNRGASPQEQAVVRHWLQKIVLAGEPNA